MAVLTKEEYKLADRAVSALERIAKQMEILNSSVMQVEVMNGDEEEEEEDEEEELLTGEILDIHPAPAD